MRVQLLLLGQDYLFPLFQMFQASYVKYCYLDNATVTY